MCQGCGQTWTFKRLIDYLSPDADSVEGLLAAAKEAETRALSSRWMIEQDAPPLSVSRTRVTTEHARNLDIQISVWAGTYPGYLESRQFPRSFCRENLVGFDTERRRVTFPVYDDATLVGVVGRAVLDEDQPKYWFYEKLKRGFHLYSPLHVVRPLHKQRRLYVVEGPTDALRLAQKGYPFVVATFGARMTRHQANMISRFATKNDLRVVLMYDNWMTEVAGDRATAHAGRLLCGRVPGTDALVGVYPTGVNDPGDLRPVHRKKPFRTVRFTDWLTGTRPFGAAARVG